MDCRPRIDKCRARVYNRAMTTPNDDLIVHCPNGHGRMPRREHPDKLAALHGEWFDCTTCRSSTLIRPDDLLTPDEIARSER